jgi:hypothetical protein
MHMCYQQTGRKGRLGCQGSGDWHTFSLPYTAELTARVSQLGKLD